MDFGDVCWFMGGVLVVRERTEVYHTRLSLACALITIVVLIGKTYGKRRYQSLLGIRPRTLSPDKAKDLLDAGVRKQLAQLDSLGSRALRTASSATDRARLAFTESTEKALQPLRNAVVAPLEAAMVEWNQIRQSYCTRTVDNPLQHAGGGVGLAAAAGGGGSLDKQQPQPPIPAGSPRADRYRPAADEPEPEEADPEGYGCVSK
eukprot:COSAG05_NODE_2725_length_2724_cov_360.992762_4_plen_205_part_00